MMNLEAAAGLGSDLIGLPETDSVTEFERRLISRTKVPADRLGEFLEWPDDRIRRETELVSRVLKRFAQAVVGSMEDPRSADDFLRELDLRTISRDHDWRAIFSTIRAQERGHGRYKRSVLIKYLQYLSFRKRLLEFIYSRRQGLEETDGYTELTAYPGGLAAPREAGDLPDQFRRLPLGECVHLRLRSGQQAELMLAAHHFRLIGGTPPTLMDANGVTYFVRRGRNMVGRHPESDITVDQNFGDVSRAHMILEWDGRDQLGIVDLSSRGTSLRGGSVGHLRAAC